MERILICIILFFQVDVSHFLTPGFHLSFLEVLKYMEKQDTTIKQARAFKRFIRDYGTHYISSAYMGSKVATTIFYDNYERLKYGRQQLNNCSDEVAKSSFGLQPEPEEEDDDEDEEGDGEEAENTEQRRCPEVLRITQ